MAGLAALFLNKSHSINKQIWQTQVAYVGNTKKKINSDLNNFRHVQMSAAIRIQLNQRLAAVCHLTTIDSNKPLIHVPANWDVEKQGSALTPKQN